MIFSEVNAQEQVDITDMKTCADNEYTFMMVYQNHLTTFVLLSALSSIRPA